LGGLATAMQEKRPEFCGKSTTLRLPPLPPQLAMYRLGPPPGQPVHSKLGGKGGNKNSPFPHMPHPKRSWQKKASISP
jgi:hypothetical protein